MPVCKSYYQIGGSVIWLQKRKKDVTLIQLGKMWQKLTKVWHFTFLCCKLLCFLELSNRKCYIKRSKYHLWNTIKTYNLCIFVIYSKITNQMFQSHIFFFNPFHSICAGEIQCQICALLNPISLILCRYCENTRGCR